MTATGTLGDHRGWYALLGVEPSADEHEIRRAYKAAARRWHPDVNPSPDAAEVMRELNEAVRVLTDPWLRSGYDATVPPVDHGISFAPAVADLGEIVQGRPASVTVRVDCVVPTDDLHVDRLSGPWWTATASVPTTGDALLEFEITVDTSEVGSFADCITLTAGGTPHELRLAMTVTAPGLVTRVMRGVTGTATGTAVGSRRLAGRAARGVRHADRRWETLPALYSRGGLLLCLLWGLVPQLVTHTYGILPRIVGMEETRLFLITSRLAPVMTWIAVGLFAVTLGARRAGSVLRTLSILVATTGWVVGFLCALWLLALAVYIAAVILAIVTVFAVLAS
ncbi:MAG: J domain-containing protein [Ilumatobacteraceae bacterium]